jgi:NAD(P)-dependent dehydrogenase (short-subunit alcohol dehydrogenase family)
VEILGRGTGDISILPHDSVHHTFCDLLDFDEELFTSLAADQSVEILLVTAGIGRVADFEYFHPAEIEKMFTVDTVSTIKIFRIFYDRIKSRDSFYAGVMGSISGWMSTPSAAVYAAAKAGVVRFVESVNIELEVAGVDNRILDVSPASFKGSKFYGGKNDISLMSGLAGEIYLHMVNRETRYIPQYEEVFKGVLERYHNDPHEYSVHSYHYKESSGRKDNTRRVRVGRISGTFNPFGPEQVNLLKEAKSKCDYLIVEVTANSPESSGNGLMTLEEVKTVVGACRYVDRVVEGNQ